MLTHRRSAGEAGSRVRSWALHMAAYRPRQRGVALDMDGIILDGMLFHVQAWEAAFRQYGVEIDPGDLYLLEGVKSREVVEWIASQRELRLTDDQRNGIATLKRRIYAELFRVVPLPGGPELVRTLAGFGYRLALVTGTSHVAATRMLRELELVRAIPFVVSADSVPSGKPAPDPFSAALDLLAVPAANCLAVENAPPGVLSALAAGLRCVAVATYLPAAALNNATKVFDTLDSLTAWFKSEHQASHGVGPWQIDSRRLAYV